MCATCMTESPRPVRTLRGVSYNILGGGGVGYRSLSTAQQALWRVTISNPLEKEGAQPLAPHCLRLRRTWRKVSCGAAETLMCVTWLWLCDKSFYIPRSLHHELSLLPGMDLQGGLYCILYSSSIRNLFFIECTTENSVPCIWGAKKGS